MLIHSVQKKIPDYIKKKKEENNILIIKLKPPTFED